MILKPPPTAAALIQDIIPTGLRSPRQGPYTPRQLGLQQRQDADVDHDLVDLYMQENAFDNYMVKLRKYGYSWIIPLGKRKTHQDEINEETNDHSQDDEGGAIDDDDDNIPIISVDGFEDDDVEDDDDGIRDLDAEIEDLDAFDGETEDDEENAAYNYSNTDESAHGPPPNTSSDENILDRSATDEDLLFL